MAFPKDLQYHEFDRMKKYFAEHFGHMDEDEVEYYVDEALGDNYYWKFTYERKRYWMKLDRVKREVTSGCFDKLPSRRIVPYAD